MTIRELARLTGTSPTAVSLVLNKRPHRYAAKTAARIERAARKYQYVPTVYAQTMRTKRHGNLFVIQGARVGQSTFNTIVQRGFHEAILRHGERMGLAFVDDAAFHDPGFLRATRRQWQCDGFAFAYNHTPPASLLDQIRANPFPCVWFNQKQPHDSTHPDNEGGALALTQSATRLGHRRIAFVKWESSPNTPEHFSVRDREAGYCRAMSAAGLRPQIVTVPPGDAPGAVGFFRALLDRRDRPSAWIFYSGTLAKPFVSAALANRLRIPEEVSIATFGVAHELWDCGLKIQYAIEYFDRLGQALGELLARKLEAPLAPLHTVVIPMDLREGCETLGPAPRARAPGRHRSSARSTRLES